MVQPVVRPDRVDDGLVEQPGQLPGHQLFQRLELGLYVLRVEPLVEGALLLRPVDRTFDDVPPVAEGHSESLALVGVGGERLAVAHVVRALAHVHRARPEISQKQQWRRTFLDPLCPRPRPPCSLLSPDLLDVRAGVDLRLASLEHLLLDQIALPVVQLLGVLPGTVGRLVHPVVISSASLLPSDAPGEAQLVSVVRQAAEEKQMLAGGEPSAGRGDAATHLPPLVLRSSRVTELKFPHRPHSLFLYLIGAEISRKLFPFQRTWIPMPVFTRTLSFVFSISSWFSHLYGGFTLIPLIFTLIF